MSEELKPCGYLTGSGTVMAEDMYYRLEDAQAECERHNDFERMQPDFDPENLRAPEPVYRGAAPVAARELDVEAERRAMFHAFSECLVHGNSMTPTEIADKLLAARSAAQSTAPVSTEQAGDAWGVGSCACQACNPHMVGRMMFICPTCGDKRCPHAASHVLNCQRLAPSPNNSPVGADRRE